MFVKSCLVLVAVLVQICLATKPEVKLTLNIKKAIPGQIDPFRHTVILNGNALSVTLFTDKTDITTIKKLIPGVASSIAQEIIFRDYDDGAFKTICSQMYYQVGIILTYEILFNKQTVPVSTLNDAYQAASDSAFEGLGNQASLDFENALNKYVFSAGDSMALTFEDYVNLYNGQFKDSKFFDKFLDGVKKSNPTASTALRTEYEKSFSLEKDSFVIISNLINDLLKAFKDNDVTL